MDEYTEGRYDTILSRDSLTALGLYLKVSEQVTKGGDGTYKG